MNRIKVLQDIARTVYPNWMAVGRIKEGKEEDMRSLVLPLAA